jgi:hypothetical protein
LLGFVSPLSFELVQASSAVGGSEARQGCCL